MLVNGIKKDYVQVDVRPKDAILSLIKYYFNSDIFTIAVKQNDDGIECLYDEIDVSVHGSPVYEYNFITSDKDKVELFKCLQRAYFLID